MFGLKAVVAVLSVGIGLVAYLRRFLVVVEEINAKVIDLDAETAP